MLHKSQLTENIRNFKKQGEEFLALADLHLFKEKKTFEDGSAILLAIFQKNYNVFKTVHFLLDVTNTGVSVLVLSRSILESMINVEYMQLGDVEKNLNMFKDFENAEAKQDIDVTALNPDEINRIYEVNRSQFEKSKGEIWQSWSHKNFEQMLDVVIKERNFPEAVRDTLVNTYIQSNRATHLSPSQVKLHLIDGAFEYKDLSDKSLGYISALSSMIKIADFLSMYLELKEFEASLEKLFNGLDDSILNEEK